MKAVDLLTGLRNAMRDGMDRSVKDNAEIEVEIPDGTRFKVARIVVDDNCGGDAPVAVIEVELP